MLQIHLKEDDPVTHFIEARASQLGMSVSEVASEVLRESFLHAVKTLHTQFMAGEISQGYMAESLGIQRLELIHLLNDLQLPINNL
jgi:hypothetical protein